MYDDIFILGMEPSEKDIRAAKEMEERIKSIVRKLFSSCYSNVVIQAIPIKNRTASEVIRDPKSYTEMTLRRRVTYTTREMD